MHNPRRLGVALSPEPWFIQSRDTRMFKMRWYTKSTAIMMSPLTHHFILSNSSDSCAYSPKRWARSESRRLLSSPHWTTECKRILTYTRRMRSIHHTSIDWRRSTCLSTGYEHQGRECVLSVRQHSKEQQEHTRNIYHAFSWPLLDEMSKKPSWHMSIRGIGRSLMCVMILCPFDSFVDSWQALVHL